MYLDDDTSIMTDSPSQRIMDDNSFGNHRSNDDDDVVYPSNREFGWGPSYFAVFMIVLTLWMRHAL